MDIRKTSLCQGMRWRYVLLITLLVTILLFKYIPNGGMFYTAHVYPVIGYVLSWLSGIFPFAVGDIFIALSIVWVVLYPIYQVVLRKKLAKRFIFLVPKGNMYPSKKKVFGRVLEYLLWLYVWFYLAWGLNYSQPNVYHRIGMKPVEVSAVKLKEFAYRYADSLNYYSEELKDKQGEFIPKHNQLLREKTKNEILKQYDKLNGKDGVNAPFTQNPHAKTMVFSRFSSMAGVTGSMGPFFCEFTLNGDVRSHDYPATYAHEFAHFLGIANEGEANLYSYIVCIASSDRAIKFSGYYHIFFHVLNNVFDILGEKEGEKYLKYIRPGIIQLAKSDRKYWLDKRCKALDAAQDFLFDLYLKGNHVAEGRKSYSGVIGLILAWEEKTTSSF